MLSGVAGKWHEDPMFVGANVEHEGQVCSAAAAVPSDHQQISLGLKLKQNEDSEAWSACFCQTAMPCLKECK